MAEAYLNARGPGHLRAFSAGIVPAAVPHHEVLEVLQRGGISADRLSPKSAREILQNGHSFDLVFALLNDTEDATALRAIIPFTAVWTIPSADAPAANRGARGQVEETFALLRKRIDYLRHLSLRQLENLTLLAKPLSTPGHP